MPLIAIKRLIDAESSKGQAVWETDVDAFIRNLSLSSEIVGLSHGCMVELAGRSPVEKDLWDSMREKPLEARVVLKTEDACNRLVTLIEEYAAATTKKCSISSKPPGESQPG
jgi:hypothetical protein